MYIEQFVMAYKAEQDRLRAMLPEGFESLRPVLRINAEIRKETEAGAEKNIYLEFNTPVAGFGKRGWLNIGNWQSPETDISCTRNGSAVTFHSSFIEITYTSVGIEGGCPAEKDNDGCFFIGKTPEFVPSKKISSNKVFCDCEFKWKFADNDACGISIGGKSIAAIPTEQVLQYEKQSFTPQNAAKIVCEQILGAYTVQFAQN